MPTDIEIDRVLALVAATLNDHELDHFDAGQVQRIVSAALGNGPALTVDDGGGLHNAEGVRVGAIRRTDSGEWIADRQNYRATRSDAVIPSFAPQSKLRGLLGRFGR